MRIARVFPSRTSFSPLDRDAYFSTPEMFMPKYDEVHISCTFTWDIARANELAYQWANVAPVKIGGPAIDGESLQPFQAGVYLRKGITITSRGCPNLCSFCMVRKGALIEFDDFPVGNIIQDNNFLACSSRHRSLVYKMLQTQKEIEFKGGLDKKLVTTEIAEELRGLRIKTLWLACDTTAAVEPLRRAVDVLLKAGFTRNHLYCYVLIGNDRTENEARLREVWNIGCMPFAQLYINRDNSIRYSREWRDFARQWSRPAITRKINESKKVLTESKLVIQ